MESRKSQWLLRILTTLLMVSFWATGVAAQDDPDPNSPTPILLSENGSTRALAVPDDSAGPTDISKARSRAFQPNAKIRLFVTNIKLMENEGASAFRLYVEDALGRKYRFPVLKIEPDQSPTARKGVYAVTAVLTDEFGFWDPPAADGDVLVGITWRGLISNRVRLGYGQIGGRIKDDPDAVPTPLASATIAKGKFSSNDGASPEYVGYKWSGDRMRFMEHATFGPTAALDSRIRRIGLKTWLAEQFEATYPSISFPYPNQPLKTSNQGADLLCDGLNGDDVPLTCVRDTYTMYQPQKWFFQEALYGDAQLKHRVAWTLSQIWVTAFPEVQQSRHMTEYHKILSKHAFGNYRNLMKEMTLHPTMGNYLDMAISTKNNPNENYARELMQLFTIGLFQLNQDGTLKFDASSNPIPTYDQNGVNDLTKVLTGWTFCSVAANCPSIVGGTVNYIDPMRINNTSNHDLTAKTLLSWPADPAFPPNNTTVAACTNCTTGTNDPNVRIYADASMDKAVDNIFNHPNVGPFVSKILIQHMVTSDPTPAYVGRVAAVFNENRTNPAQMKEVVKAILLDPEARGDIKTDPHFGKLREPVQLATNFLRALNVRSANGLSQSDGVIFQRGEFTGMSQIPFRSPTVFNYYPPDFVTPGSALLAPEFAIMTTGTTIQRGNFMNRFVFTAPAIAGGTTDNPDGTSLEFADLQALVTADTTGNLLLDELNRRMLHNTMSTAMRNTILPVVTSVVLSNPPTNAQTLSRAQQAVYLIATSSQYQVQR